MHKRKPRAVVTKTPIYSARVEFLQVNVANAPYINWSVLPLLINNPTLLIDCTETLLSCDSIEKLRKKCENFAMEKELKDPPKFKDFYQFTFNFAKNPGQKGLGVFSFPNSLEFAKETFSLTRFGHGSRVLEHCHDRKIQVPRSLVSVSTGEGVSYM